jgi:glutaredoxin-related protein
MNTWDFVVSELKSLQQEFNDHQAIVELFVEQRLLCGYNIIKSKHQVYRLQNANMLEV